MTTKKVVSTETINQGEQLEDIIIKDKGADETLTELSKQPKMPLMIPIDPMGNNEPLLVVVNGTIYALPKGKLLQVPMTVFEIAQESMIKTMQVKQDITITSNNA